MTESITKRLKLEKHFLTIILAIAFFAISFLSERYEPWNDMLEDLGVQAVNLFPETVQGKTTSRLLYGIADQSEAVMVAVTMGSELEFSYGYDETFHIIVSSICLVIFVAGYFFSQLMIEIINQKNKALNLLWHERVINNFFAGSIFAYVSMFISFLLIKSIIFSPPARSLAEKYTLPNIYILLSLVLVITAILCSVAILLPLWPYLLLVELALLIGTHVFPESFLLSCGAAILLVGGVWEAVGGWFFEKSYLLFKWIFRFRFITIPVKIVFWPLWLLLEMLSGKNSE